jgi:uncharacterized protein (UPF0333 family)
MDRRLLLLVVAVVALVGVVNATVYAYRWITGTVNIVGSDQATGAACTGFYSSAAQPDISGYLPPAGTNYNAKTYGSYEISVTPIYVVCQWTNETNGKQVQLYEGIDVSIPITIGSWYIQDFYGFGYNGTTGDPPVNVWFRVEETNLSSLVTTAYLIIRKPDGTMVGSLDLTSKGNMNGSFTLSPGSGWRLDLYINATYTGTAWFKVGVYVSQSTETPRP